MSDTDKAEHAAFLAEVGRGLAELHTQYYGKGPSQTRTYMLNDTLLCLLEGGFTTVEATLIADGNSEAVHEIRRSFQQAMEQPFKDVVEGATKRQVLAYMSQIHTSPDLAAELFVLEPQMAPVHGEHNEEEGMRPDSARGESARGEVLASVSTGLVRLHSRYYGKGPTKAKTYLVTDTVVCLLRGGFTTVERTLIDEGNVDAVYEIRRSFQQAMEEHFTNVVEGATGRKVIAYMSQIHQDPDLAVEIFVLEPSEQGGVGMHEQDLPGEELRS